MLKGRLLRVLALTALIGTVATTIAEAAPSAPTVRAAQAAGPFDSPTVFCTKQAPPPGTRNSSNPGVTPNSITMSDASIDAGALRRIGLDLVDFSDTFTALWNEVNKCGGINGRKIIVKKALYNPLAVDSSGHLQAECLKITEDQKALVAYSIGAGTVEKCVSITHKTIFTAQLANSEDFAASKGRIISIYPAGDRLAAGFIADAHNQGDLKGHKIGVITAARTPTAVNEAQDQYVDGLKAKGYNVASFEVLPCQGIVCTQGIGQSIRRMKDKDVDLLVLSHQISVATFAAVFRELKQQNYKLQVMGPDFDGIQADQNLANLLRTAGADAAKFAADNGWYATAQYDIRNAWRQGQSKETPFGKMCTSLVAKATGTRQYLFNEDDFASAKWGSVTIACIYVRNIARAIWSLGNNVTTERLAAALGKQKATDFRETQGQFHDKAWYAGTDVNPPKATTLKFFYPCPLPKPTTNPCMMPVDRPARVRTIKY